MTKLYERSCDAFVCKFMKFLYEGSVDVEDCGFSYLPPEGYSERVELSAIADEPMLGNRGPAFAPFGSNIASSPYIAARLYRGAP